MNLILERGLARLFPLPRRSGGADDHGRRVRSWARLDCGSASWRTYSDPPRSRRRYPGMIFERFLDISRPDPGRRR